MFAVYHVATFLAGVDGFPAFQAKSPLGDLATIEVRDRKSSSIMRAGDAA